MRFTKLSAADFFVFPLAGACVSASRRASGPSAASPTTTIPACSKSARTPWRTRTWSSARRMRMDMRTLLQRLSHLAPEARPHPGRTSGRLGTERDGGASWYPWACSSMLSPPCRERSWATAGQAWARSARPAPPSRHTFLCLHLHQHAGHERQQLVQGVEPGHLVGDQMLDAAFPRRRTTGARAKLDHKGLIVRECWVGWGHAYLPYADVRV